jgi:hypothetical protein
MTQEPTTDDENQIATRDYHTTIQNEAMATIKMNRHIRKAIKHLNSNWIATLILILNLKMCGDEQASAPM